MFLKNMKLFSQAAAQSSTQKISSKLAALIFKVAAYTLLEDLRNLSRVLKTSIMVIKPKALHVPWLMLLFHRPVQASYHRLCSGLCFAY